MGTLDELHINNQQNSLKSTTPSFTHIPEKKLSIPFAPSTLPQNGQTKYTEPNLVLGEEETDTHLNPRYVNQLVVESLKICMESLLKKPLVISDPSEPTMEPLPTDNSNTEPSMGNQHDIPSRTTPLFKCSNTLLESPNNDYQLGHSCFSSSTSPEKHPNLTRSASKPTISISNPRQPPSTHISKSLSPYPVRNSTSYESEQAFPRD